jgi:hypothetical protein
LNLGGVRMVNDHLTICFRHIEIASVYGGAGPSNVTP